MTKLAIYYIPNLQISMLWKNTITNFISVVASGSSIKGDSFYLLFFSIFHVEHILPR